MAASWVDRPSHYRRAVGVTHPIGALRRVCWRKLDIRPERAYTTMTALPSERIKLDSACDLFCEDHRIAQEIAQLFEDIKQELRDRDPGCDVVIGAAGCGSCVSESCDYAVFYVAQSFGTAEHLMLKYDTGADEDGRDPALSRLELGEVIADRAEAAGVDWSWPHTTAKCVCVGRSDAHGQYEDQYEPAV